jgi:type 2A phosphatase activator TIP41
MVFGESSLVLQHRPTGMKLHFNALDALKGWKEEALPPVEVPAAAQWKFKRFSHAFHFCVFLIFLFLFF